MVRLFSLRKIRIEFWVSIYNACRITNVPQVATGGAFFSEEEVDRCETASGRIGKAHHIIHEYEVEE